MSHTNQILYIKSVQAPHLKQCLTIMLTLLFSLIYDHEIGIFSVAQER